MKSFNLAFLSVVLAATPFGFARAEPVRVVTTLPHLADIARAIGGEGSQVSSLVAGVSDPHFVDPTPRLMAEVAGADLFVEVGLNLELWSERVLEGAGNGKVKPGAPGHVYASEGVPRLEVPALLSRAQGDLHPDGNPHIWLDPLNVKLEADNIAAGLIRVRPEGEKGYRERLATFKLRIDEAMFGAELVRILGGELLDQLARGGKLDEFLAGHSYKDEALSTRLGGWLAAMRPLAGKEVVTYHLSWTYFLDRFSLALAGTIEEKPGIPPSARHRDELEALMKARGVGFILRDSFYPPQIPETIARDTGAKHIELPLEVGGVEGSGDYFAAMDTIVRRLTGSGR